MSLWRPASSEVFQQRVPDVRIDSVGQPEDKEKLATFKMEGEAEGDLVKGTGFE